MLQQLEEKEFDQYIDLAYEISLDLSRTSFPVYTDGVKTREDFILRSRMGMDREDEELLLFTHNGQAEGVIQFYVLEKDRYIGITSISVEKHYAGALKELFQYWSEKYRGYEWDVYFPEENEEALGFMREKGLKAEESVVDVLLFKEYAMQPEEEGILHINHENFQRFAEIHRFSEEGMYWTGERIRKNLENWEIFVSEGKGAVYYNGKGQENLEIFGIDFWRQEPDMDTARSLLAACLNHAKRSGAKSMYFFNDPDIHRIVSALGFRRITTAHYFTGILEE